MRPVRLFIAVDLPEDAKYKIGSLVDELSAASRRERAEIAWVKISNFHLTLKFLGECSEEKQPDLVKALDQAVRGMPSFPVVFGGLGAFPEKGSPRVIWAGLLEGLESLAKLAERVESVFEPLGFPRENRPFSAHLTLGRVKAVKDPAKLRALVEMPKIDSLSRIVVASAVLYQSRLSPTGPTYTILHTSPLMQTT